MKGESGSLVNKLDLFLFAVENIKHQMKSFQFFDFLRDILVKRVILNGDGFIELF